MVFSLIQLLEGSVLAVIDSNYNLQDHHTGIKFTVVLMVLISPVVKDNLTGVLHDFSFFISILSIDCQRICLVFC